MSTRTDERNSELTREQVDAVIILGEPIELPPELWEAVLGFPPPPESPERTAPVVCTGVDAARGVVTFSSDEPEPFKSSKKPMKPPKIGFRTHKWGRFRGL